MPRLALLLLPPYLSLRAQIYLCELISIFLIFSLCTCANLCLSAQIYVLGVGACANLIFRFGACGNSFFLSFRTQIHFFHCGTCANLFLRFGPMRKSIFLFFRFGSVLSHAQIYVCRCWPVRYFNFPFRNSVVPCADLFLVFLTVLSHAHIHFSV